MLCASAAALSFTAVLAFSQTPASLRPASLKPEDWFARPYELPKDVFDLPEFDQFRKGTVLDVKGALSALGVQSDQHLPLAQQYFDIFAWKAFIALNWPARPDGQPDASKTFGAIPLDTPLVWEFWQQSSHIFLPDGSTPKWSGSPGATLDHFKAGWRQSTTVNEGKQAFSGPLVDQTGKWVHYVSLVNRPEFDYIVGDKEGRALYNLEGQAAYLEEHEIQFPENDDTHYGAIEIKFAWKFLTGPEVRSNRFLMKKLPVVEYRPSTAAEAPAHKSGNSKDNPASTTAPPQETLGLIGMHIAMRTRSSPQWIWATIEQIDNTRLDFTSGDDRHPLPAHPSLSNPDNPNALVGANLLPPYNAAPVPPLNASNDWDETKPMSPVEVLRLVPPPQGTAEINRLAQSFLGSKNSVFRFYELNGTQWPKHPTAPAVPGGMPSGVSSAPDSIIRKMPGEMVPVYLTNATMETYFQKGFQQAGPLEQDDRLLSQFSVDTNMVFGTESCVGCHYSAGACIGFQRDFYGKPMLDANGNKIPIFGQNGHNGLNANGNFSWLLQLEAKAKHPKP
jgi:hypothetical protein